MSRRTRTIRYGASILLILVGVVCGIAISGSAGGTLATVFVGIGFVGVVSLIFYEVGLTEDRERAARPVRSDPATDRLAPEDPGGPAPEGSPPDGPIHPAPSHGRALWRRPDRMRGQRRRLR